MLRLGVLSMNQSSSIQPTDSPGLEWVMSITWRDSVRMKSKRTLSNRRQEPEMIALSEGVHSTGMLTNGVWCGIWYSTRCLYPECVGVSRRARDHCSCFGFLPPDVRYLKNRRVHVFCASKGSTIVWWPAVRREALSRSFPFLPVLHPYRLSRRG